MVNGYTLGWLLVAIGTIVGIWGTAAGYRDHGIIAWLAGALLVAVTSELRRRG